MRTTLALRYVVSALILALPSLALFSGSTALAALSNESDTGSVTGIVVDSEGGDGLIGANVIVETAEGLVTGGATDLDGRYLVSNVRPGFYNLVVRYIGYVPKTIRNVEVVAGQTTQLDISLSSETFGLDEVVVEARAMLDNEAGLLRERQKAAAVSDAISAEAISRSGSSNAADAMEKVTGASVVGGKYVYVRGLGERYSSTHLNGVELPTADPDKKAVQFDLFPANLLENIVTVKTFTPDKPGNFSGGLVDIGTKAFPEELSIRFSATTSVNTQTHFGNHTFLTYPGGKTDWLGIDDGVRAIPSTLSDPDVEIPSAQRARFDPELAAQLNEQSESFNAVMSPISKTPPVSSSYALSIGNQEKLARRPLGFVLSMTYSRTADGYDDGTYGRYSYTGSDLNTDLILNDVQASEEVTWGGLANLSYKLDNNHELGFNSLYTRNAVSTAREQVGYWPKELGDDPTSTRTNRYLLYNERQLYSFQLRGKHALTGLLNSRVEWNGSIAHTDQDEPDRRFFASTQRILGGNEVLSASSSGFQDPSRYFRTLDEDSRSAQLDISIPFRQWSRLSGKVKIGGAYQYAERRFTERIFAYRASSEVTYDGDNVAYFDDPSMGVLTVDTLGARLRFNFGNTIADNSKVQNNYTGQRRIPAAYAMLDVPLARRLRMIGGARWEYTDLSVVSADSTQAVGSVDEHDILPSLNLVYQLSERMNLRAAFSRTLARPTFREIAPYSSFDFTVGDFRIGNPELERTRITNYDLRWEWFTRPGEILALSVFYKKMDNPIEQVIIGGTNGQLQYRNVAEARVGGIELEFRKSLELLSGTLRHFSIGMNGSLVTSEVDIDSTEYAARVAVDPNASRTRELQGQSPFLVNADLTFDNPKTGTTAGLYFNIFGRRLSNVSLGGTPDVFERSSPQLNLTVIQRFRSSWALKFGAQNLLNKPFRQTHRFVSSTGAEEDFIYQEYNPGISFSLGFSYTR